MVTFGEWQTVEEEEEEKEEEEEEKDLPYLYGNTLVY